MTDRDAFVTFLGEEVRVLTAGAAVNFFVKCPGADQSRYTDQMMPLQDVLYKFVRCALSHEGRIGQNVDFVESDRLSVEIKEDRLILGGGFLSRLITIAEYAPENAGEFPLIADMPQDVVGWSLFGQRREAHAEYLRVRQERLNRGNRPTSSLTRPPSA
jgi:hypothetical protein